MTRVKLPAVVKALLKKAPTRPFPTTARPMLATLAGKPFSDNAWSYEVKWDGYRALAFLHKGEVTLKSRNDKLFNDKFYAVHDALKQWPINAVIDGEIIVTNANGISSFGALQSWRSEADGVLVFYCFDILWLDGRDLTGLPWIERRAVLRAVLPQGHDMIRLSETFTGTGEEAFKTAKKMSFEGLIAKRNDSIYEVDARSKVWLKLKAQRRQEMVIGGYTNNEGSSKPFSSLLVGVFDGKCLHFTGKVGTGFTIKAQQEMLRQFRPLIRKTNPFREMPDINSPSRFRPDPPKATATWMAPKLVCEVSFTEITKEGVMRHPSFEGMRIDKTATEVVLEYARETETQTRTHKALAAKKIIAPSAKRERGTLLNPADESQMREIGGHELKLGHLSKPYWPDEGISKRDMLNYYYKVAPYILPYLKGRPQSLNRHPNGITGKQFYQKDVKGKVPHWIHTFRYYSEMDQREKEFFICDDEASLIYLASLGCIEISPWNSSAETPDQPDWCVIDLDPDQNTFNQVIQTAQVTRQLLEAIGVTSYCKTSGSTGLHIYIPLGAKYSYEDSKEFARALVTRIHAELLTFTSIERQVADRRGKMYLDFLQNRPQATIVAPYSLRPKPGAPVSMPLHWEEVKPGLKMLDFTIHNAIARIQETGDLFRPVLGKGIKLPAVRKKLEVL